MLHQVDKVTGGDFLTRNEKQLLAREGSSRVSNMSSLLSGCESAVLSLAGLQSSATMG